MSVTKTTTELSILDMPLYAGESGLIRPREENTLNRWWKRSHSNQHSPLKTLLPISILRAADRGPVFVCRGLPTWPTSARIRTEDLWGGFLWYLFTPTQSRGRHDRHVTRVAAPVVKVCCVISTSVVVTWPAHVAHIHGVSPGTSLFSFDDTIPTNNSQRNYVLTNGNMFCSCLPCLL